MLCVWKSVGTMIKILLLFYLFPLSHFLSFHCLLACIAGYTPLLWLLQCVHRLHTFVLQQKAENAKLILGVFFLVFLWLFWALIALNDECVNFRCAWAFPFRQKFIRNWMKWNGLCMCASHRAGYLFEHIKKNLISK